MRAWMWHAGRWLGASTLHKGCVVGRALLAHQWFRPRAAVRRHFGPLLPVLTAKASELNGTMAVNAGHFQAEAPAVGAGGPGRGVDAVESARRRQLARGADVRGAGRLPPRRRQPVRAPVPRGAAGRRPDRCLDLEPVPIGGEPPGLDPEGRPCNLGSNVWP